MRRFTEVPWKLISSFALFDHSTSAACFSVLGPEFDSGKRQKENPGKKKGFIFAAHSIRGHLVWLLKDLRLAQVRQHHATSQCASPENTTCVNAESCLCSLLRMAIDSSSCGRTSNQSNLPLTTGSVHQHQHKHQHIPRTTFISNARKESLVRLAIKSSISPSNPNSTLQTYCKKTVREYSKNHA